MDFTPTLSMNPQLRKAMTRFAEQLMIRELLPDQPDEVWDSFNEDCNACSVMDDMIEDMVQDSFYKMLDMMRDTMKEYERYVIEAMEEANE